MTQYGKIIVVKDHYELTNHRLGIRSSQIGSNQDKYFYIWLTTETQLNLGVHLMRVELQMSFNYVLHLFTPL